jgi:hypothetical protein
MNWNKMHKGVLILFLEFFIFFTLQMHIFLLVFFEMQCSRCSLDTKFIVHSMPPYKIKS